MKEKIKKIFATQLRERRRTFAFRKQTTETLKKPLNNTINQTIKDPFDNFDNFEFKEPIR